MLQSLHIKRESDTYFSWFCEGCGVLSRPCLAFLPSLQEMRWCGAPSTDPAILAMRFSSVSWPSETFSECLLPSRHYGTFQECGSYPRRELTSSPIPGSLLCTELSATCWGMQRQTRHGPTHAGLPRLQKRSEQLTCYTLAMEGC